MTCCSCYEYLALAVLAYIIVGLSSTVRYYFKLLIFSVGSILLATLLPIPMFIVRPRDYRNAL